MRARGLSLNGVETNVLMGVRAGGTKMGMGWGVEGESVCGRERERETETERGCFDTLLQPPISQKIQREEGY